MNSPSQFHCRRFFVVHHATIKINSTRDSLKCWIVLPFLVFIFYVCSSTIQFQSTLYTENNFCVTLRLESEQGLSRVVFSKLAKLYGPTHFLSLSPLLFCNRPKESQSSSHRSWASEIAITCFICHYLDSFRRSFMFHFPGNLTVG
jgi:hypothetical protein